MTICGCSVLSIDAARGGPISGEWRPEHSEAKTYIRGPQCRTLQYIMTVILVKLRFSECETGVGIVSIRRFQRSELRLGFAVSVLSERLTSPPAPIRRMGSSPVRVVAAWALEFKRLVPDVTSKFVRMTVGGRARRPAS